MVSKTYAQSKPGAGDRLLRVDEVAERLGLTVAAIRRMIFEKRLEVVRVSARAVRVREAYLTQFIAAKTYPAEPVRN